MVGFRMRMGKYFGIFRYHGVVLKLNRTFRIEIAAMIPRHVFANFDIVSVVETAALVGDKSVAAFFEKVFCDNLSERNCKRHVYAKRNSVYALPKDMQISLLGGIGHIVRDGQAVRPQDKRFNRLFVIAVNAYHFKNFNCVFCVHSLVAETGESFKHIGCIHFYLPKSILFRKRLYHKI